MNYIKLIFLNLSKFVNLPANEQIVYLMICIIIITIWLTVFFYKKNENAHEDIRKELQGCEVTVTKLTFEKDSLYKVIYLKDVEMLLQRANRSDSLLRESEKIKNSIPSLIKKINKKIENNK
jgi:hypothetical protein